MPTINRISAYLDDMREWRRDIHRYPELAYQEQRTAGRVAGLLREFGIDEIAEGIGKTGVVGVIRNGAGPTIGLRADMDALPITELTGLPYQSAHDGSMHACGHDGHTTMLLGAARYLTETRNFNGTVVLVFQPAEEGFAGAQAMIDDGLFTRYPVDAIYGMHNMPGLPAGTITVSPGTVMAAADAFSVAVTGRGGHGAMPHLAADPVVAAAAMVAAIQPLVSRNTDPHKTLVISVTQIHGGDAFNVIPDDVTLGGTIRYFDAEVGAAARRNLETVVSGVAAAHRVSAELDYRPGYPPTTNHAREAEFAETVAVEVTGGPAMDQPKVMGSEDFSFFLNNKPGAYAWIGNGDSATQAQLHNAHYDFNDDILPIGASFLARLAEIALARD
ncbi:MAG: M20 aminoacylase family protein [Alphaproteobacteria bacterium]|jgi:hippurate hydrolase|nr:M20 aminoacylase family protein [Alphaproteobacteria bacterium]MDP6517403.1 M20 aminoacylase family protein [Alphaproteobacteria bacterium]